MTTTNIPAAVDSRTFRNVMGLFATGVTVVATDVAGEIYAMTANAVTSVSLEPTLVLVCIHKQATIAAKVRESGKFTINILTSGQTELSNYFARIWPQDASPPPFTFESWSGGPRLADTSGALACEVKEFLEGGDHWIVIAEVVDLFQQDIPDEPLLYYRGRYRFLLDVEDNEL